MFCSVQKNWYCFKKAHQIKGQNQGGSSRLVQIPTSIFLKAGREGILGEKNEAIGVQSRILVQLVFLFRFGICITEEITGRVGGREEVCQPHLCHLCPAQPHLCHCLYSPSTAGASSSSPLVEPPPIGAILRLHCPYDARSTSCLSGKTKCESNPRQMIFSNLTIIDVFPLVLML